MKANIIETPLPQASRLWQHEVKENQLFVLSRLRTAISQSQIDKQIRFKNNNSNRILPTKRENRNANNNRATYIATCC